MKIDIKRVVVKFNNKIVGYLQELDNKQIAFQYDDEWLRNGFSISPLSLPLSSEVYISKSPHFNGLFGVFNDSLPDGWGELLVRRMLAKKGINFDKLSPLVRLTLISGNGLGGLVYEPMQISDERQNFRLFTYEKWHADSQPLFKKIFTVEEKYYNKKDDQYLMTEGVSKIFSISLYNKRIKKFNNKFINLIDEKQLHIKSVKHLNKMPSLLKEIENIADF